MEYEAMEEDTGEIGEQEDEKLTKLVQTITEQVSAMSEPEASFLSVNKAQAASASDSTGMVIEDKSEDPMNLDLLNEFCKEASRSFFTEFGLISHQINSFNDFVDNGIHKIFDSIGEIHVKPDPSLQGELQGAIIKFGKVILEKPMFTSGTKSLKLLPKHARLQHMTYASPIKVEIEYQIYALGKEKNGKAKVGEEPYTIKKILSEGKKELVFGRLPVMVNSKLCWMNGREKGDCEFDHGGYFLINGIEKIFVAQEQICLKRLWVSDYKNWNISYRADGKRFRVDINELSKRKEVLTVHFMNCTFPLWIFLYALGMPTDKQIVQMIDINMDKANSVNILINSICYCDDHFEGFRTEGYALRKIDELFKKSKFPPKESAKDCLEKYVFPSLSSLRQKALFLTYMVKCLLQSYSGERMCENKNDIRNKRLDLASELLERELQIHVMHAQRMMIRAMQRDTHGITGLRPIEYYVDAFIVTNGINRSFSAGRWSHHFNRSEKVAGVVATLRRTNPLQITSDMRKTRLQYARKTGGDARFPHTSHIGRLCFLSTPDGENCGLVKNVVASGLVSTNLVEPLLDKLLECGMEKLAENPTLAQIKGKDKVFLDGVWIGVCESPFSFALTLRKKRRSKEVPLQVEVKRDQQQREVRIYSDAGRILRPLLLVENIKKISLLKGNCDIHSLLNERIIELIGVEEEEDCHTAWDIKILLSEGEGYTHCELDASFVLGLSCGIIPFTNHDPAKRILYQSEKHSQQAIGFSTTNPNIRVDTLSHHLHYPQRPLFHTMLSDSLGKPEYHLGPNFHPKPEIYNGQNAIVAVNIHQGYNQEDSLVMNRASAERGLFRTEHLRNYKAETENNETKRPKKGKVQFGKAKSIRGNVSKLDDDGFPYIGADLKSDDIVIGMCVESGADPSIKLKHTEGGKVQKVVLSANDEGKNFAAVSLRQVRQPIVGDKFSSMHGQKGVIGLMESQENFPFTSQGIVPDIVINPHAFATRQTVGQLLEAALGKGIASGGRTRHATPFTTPSISVITEQLQRAGFARWGHEKVCSGLYGNLMQAMIFVGPTFYQRLAIMSNDQVKTRSEGPVNPYTHQPVSDRKRFGGLKLGEMERDCFLAYGAAQFLHERLLTLSDLTQMSICSKCSNMTAITKIQLPDGSTGPAPYCRLCESRQHIVQVNMPYGAKLLTEELLSMGVYLKFGTKLL